MCPNPDLNEVVLRGRVAAAPTSTELPSGDELVSLRLVVRRPPPRKGRPAAPAVDTLDCAAWLPRPRRTVLSFHPGDIVEITGALRRRFWRSPAGPRSRWEVEVASARRVQRPSGQAASGAESA